MLADVRGLQRAAVHSHELLWGSGPHWQFDVADAQVLDVHEHLRQTKEFRNQLAVVLHIRLNIRERTRNRGETSVDVYPLVQLQRLRREWLEPDQVMADKCRRLVEASVMIRLYVHEWVSDQRVELDKLGFVSVINLRVSQDLGLIYLVQRHLHHFETCGVLLLDLNNFIFHPLGPDWKGKVPVNRRVIYVDILRRVVFQNPWKYRILI